MNTVHDYTTIRRQAQNLESTNVLVGESGGLSAVYDVWESHLVDNCVVVETEHGPLYLDKAAVMEVLA